MRIVFVSNWWYRRGGLGAMMLDEVAELERRGHEIVPFAARHPNNIDTPWSSYFPESFNTADLGTGMTFAQKARATARLIDNRAATASFVRLLEDARPDLVHLHNAVRQLSPAILRPARRRGLPVVITQHDYALLCPQGQLLKADRRPCTPPDCTRGNPIPVIAYRCIRGRLVPSAVAALEYAVHRSRHAYAAPERWLIAPSRFAEKTLLAAGFPAGRVRYLPNGIDPGPEPPAVPLSGGQVLFAGRLVREKGLGVLLAAASLLPDVPIVVAGDGPLRRSLESRAPSSVRFVGEQPPDDLAQLRAASVAHVSPSIWYENAPITVLEAMRAGRPSIVTSLGGQPELVEDSGLVVPPRNARELANAISAVWRDRALAERLGRAARARLVARYTLVQHVGALEAIYQDAIAAGRVDGSA
jgi:glycosyltransferase involved in cell wall biosynthesis